MKTSYCNCIDPLGSGFSYCCCRCRFRKNWWCDAHRYSLFAMQKEPWRHHENAVEIAKIAIWASKWTYFYNLSNCISVTAVKSVFELIRLDRIVAIFCKIIYSLPLEILFKPLKIFYPFMVILFNSSNP